MFDPVFSLPEILTPPKSEGSPIMVKILKNYSKAVFDSSKEAFWCTERNAKDPISLKRTVTEKIKKNLPKIPFLVFLVKIGSFWRLFLIFSESVFCKELGFFAKNPSSLQNTDSEKIRNNLQKDPILTKNTKNGIFGRFFLIFSVTVLFKEMGSLALRSVHQNASFELSNTAFE